METLLKQNGYQNMGAIAKSLYKRFRRTRAGVLTKLHAMRAEALKAGNIKAAVPAKRAAAPAKKAATKSAGNPVGAIQMQTIKIPVSKVTVVEEAGQVFLELKF